MLWTLTRSASGGGSEKPSPVCSKGTAKKQIAFRLGLSPLTAHQYVKSLYRRFRVHSHAELLAYFLRRQRALFRSNGLAQPNV